MNGPPDNNTASPPAFLYVLYCDPALCDKPALPEAGRQVVSLSPSDGERAGVRGAPNSAIHATSRRRPTLRKPHVDSVPYPPVMYINPRYGPKNVQAEILIHETGHELGLAGRATNAFAYHCLDKKCLMNWTIRYHIARSLIGIDPINQRHLCALCIAQLTQSAKQSPPTNLHFRRTSPGSFRDQLPRLKLTRSREDYCRPIDRPGLS